MMFVINAVCVTIAIVIFLCDVWTVCLYCMNVFYCHFHVMTVTFE